MKCLLLIGMCICSNILHGALTPSDMSMAMFKSGLVKEPTVFKVMISVAGHDYCWDYQIDRFRDQFWAVRMRSVHSKDDLERTGLYCTRRALASWRWQTGRLVPRRAARALRVRCYAGIISNFATLPIFFAGDLSASCVYGL